MIIVNNLIYQFDTSLLQWVCIGKIKQNIDGDYVEYFL